MCVPRVSESEALLRWVSSTVKSFFFTAGGEWCVVNGWLVDVDVDMDLDLDMAEYIRSRRDGTSGPEQMQAPYPSHPILSYEILGYFSYSYLVCICPTE